MHPLSEALDLSGQRALVTGASQGIGAEIARCLAAAGATSLLVSRRADALEEVADQIRSAGGKAEVRTADIEDAEQVSRLAAGVGEIDILVNNAVVVVEKETGPIDLIDTDPRRFDRALAANLRTPYVLARELGRGMARRKRGSIVNIGSASALWIEPGFGPYSISKAALAALTRSLAIELAPHGVRCNAIAPGLIETPATAAEELREQIEHVRRRIPIGRVGQAREIANTVVWMASDAASFLVGQVLVIDGGMTLGPFEQNAG